MKELTSVRIKKSIDELTTAMFNSINPEDITPATKFLFDTFIASMKNEMQNHRLMETMTKKIY